MAADLLLAIEDLTVAYRTEGAELEAVRQASLRIESGETFGLVGESGSGKTTLALAIMRHLPANGSVKTGSIKFDGRDLLSLSVSAMRAIWGAEIAFVPQDPHSSLNPSMRVGEQLAETLRRHFGLNGQEARERSLELFEMVQLADPGRVMSSYPHQISGGMQQRVLIAMALSTEPKLLILDEPTTSLDATTQAAVLDLIRDLISEHGTAALYVTHNLGVVAQVCDRVGVLYAGDWFEDGPTDAIYKKPLHPYTRGLIDSVPRLGENKAEVQLRAIDGRIPELTDLPSGCIFKLRCPLAIEVCEQYPPLYQAGDDRSTRCHRWEEIRDGEVSAKQPEPETPAVSNRRLEEDILRVEDVKVHFPRQRTLFELLSSEPAKKVKAVDGVDLIFQRGYTLGLVGESGSGKTTLARSIMGLVPRTEGRMILLGEDLPAQLSNRSIDTRRHLQIVIQNPNESLNPYLSIGESLSRPYQTLLGLSQEQANERVLELLQSVHLSPEYANRLPAELSGGEKQRVAVARAFATSPELMIADEAVSSLDVSVQASILNLLNELQEERGSATFFISHDLAVVGFLADKIAVIYLGRLMEIADSRALFNPPYHPYTEALLSAIPLMDPQAFQERIRLGDEVPTPEDVPSGCPFHTRCPRYIGDICVEEQPPWRETESGGWVYCHHPIEDLMDMQTRVFRFDSSGEAG